MADTILKLTKSIDGEKRESLTIEIDNKGVFIPTSIITDFLEGEGRSIRVTVPE